MIIPKNRNCGVIAMERTCKTFVTISLVSLFWLVPVWAQNITKIGTSAAKFLAIPVGSRALGMGGAFVSLADDATSMYWNPGGLANLTEKEIFVMHSEWIANINFDYLALAIPVGGAGAFGVNVTAMTMDEFDVTTEEFPEGTDDTFSASSFAVGITYSHKLTDHFSIGGNFKFINEKIAASNARAFAVDIGTIFQTPLKGVRLGASITNFGEKIQITGDDLLVQNDIAPNNSGNNPNVNAFLATGEFDLPLLLRIGVSWDVINTDKNRLTLAVDGAHPNDNTEYANIGGEYALFDNTIFIRGGYKSIFLKDSEEQLTIGGGFDYDFIRGYHIKFDYAFEQFENLDKAHKFSFSLKF